MGFRLALFLTDKGYEAVYFPATYSHHAKIAEKVPAFFAPFSHRHAAVLAGLGELGVNNLVITPRYGPRVRFISVVTTVQLDPDPMLHEVLCRAEECMICVKLCPVHALSSYIYEFTLAGKKMKLALIDKERCYREGGGGPGCGGRCIRVCPIGK